MKSLYLKTHHPTRNQNKHLARAKAGSTPCLVGLIGIVYEQIQSSRIKVYYVIIQELLGNKQLETSNKQVTTRSALHSLTMAQLEILISAPANPIQPSLDLLILRNLYAFILK